MDNDIRLTKSKDTLYFKEIKTKKEIEDEYDGFLINCDGNEAETRKIVDFLRKKNKLIAVAGYDNQFNRRIIETMQINYLVSPEKYIKNDTLKQRDSGLNHVLAKTAKQKNIEIIINFTELKELDQKTQSIRIARITQNLKICRKAKAKIKIATFAKNKKDFCTTKELQEFMISIGSSTNQSKESTNFTIN